MCSHLCLCCSVACGCLRFLCRIMCFISFIPIFFFVFGIIGGVIDTSNADIAQKIHDLVNSTHLESISIDVTDKIMDQLYGYKMADIVSNDTLKSSILHLKNADTKNKSKSSSSQTAAPIQTTENVSKMSFMTTIFGIILNSNPKERVVLISTLLPQKFRQSAIFYGSAAVTIYVVFIILYTLFCVCCKCGKCLLSKRNKHSTNDNTGIKLTHKHK